MPILSLQGADIAYEITGEGEPVVLIPGFASGAWSWEWQTPALANEFRVITFDPRGVARSETKNSEAASIDAIAEDVSRLLDHLKIESANILGISFGGFVAQEFALMFPERVRKLVLASTSFGGPNHVMPAPEVLASFDSSQGLNDTEKVRKSLTTAFSTNFVEENADEVDRFCTLREENEVPEEVYRAQLSSAIAFNTENRVNKITAETLVLTGDSDGVVPAENSRNLAKAIPNSRLEVIADVGHMAFVENAAEFNSIVLNFLKN